MHSRHNLYFKLHVHGRIILHRGHRLYTPIVYVRKSRVVLNYYL